MYTVTTHDDIYRHESPESAADLLLSHDGYEHEIRRYDDGGYCLWVSKFSRNSSCGGSPLTRSVIWSAENDLELASLDIAVKVLQSGYWESDSVMAWTDADYEAMLAENAAENEEV